MGEVTRGMIEGIKLFGTVCSANGSCDGCPVSGVHDAGMDCFEFAKEHPEKMLSALQSLQGSHTYYNEYCNRFPNANVALEDIGLFACRKIIFEGRSDCVDPQQEDCTKCWAMQYEGDVTIEDEEEQEDKPITDMSWLNAMKD